MIRNIFTGLIVSGFFTLTPSAIYAQQVEASAQLQRDSIMIGDQILLQLDFLTAEGFQVEWPVFKDTLSAQIEIISQSFIDTLKQENGQEVITQQLLITSFDSGQMRIPAIPFYFSPEGDTSRFLANTRELQLMVYAPAVDTSQTYLPIKGPKTAPIGFSDLLPWLVGLLILAGISVLVWFYLKRKNMPVEERKSPKKQIPAHIKALNLLEELKTKKLWQIGLEKQYYSELTDILRTYIEESYPVPAIEQTTDEIMEGMIKQEIGAETLNKLRTVLQLADLVKFAKEKPLPLDNDLSLQRCLDFVNETWVLIRSKTEESNGQKDA